MKQCSIPNCDSKLFSLGYCIKHYTRNRKWGDPLYISPRQRKINMTVEEFRAWFNSKLKQHGDCLLWAGKEKVDGYGRTTFNRKPKLTHHIAWYLTKGEWPEFLCHKCGNRLCCNPLHLYEGNHLLNARDKSAHGGCKIKPEDIPNIFALYAQGRSQREIAAFYKVSPPTIHRILKGKTWSHLQETQRRLCTSLASVEADLD